ncbi:MAG: DivIVA domain-containing protein [Nocardioides sp.]|uniref:DivIVA domain-containing protein n=1 Tax=Nocardioides sp. TaxID=35761 RepID=UPI0039E449B4
MPLTPEDVSNKRFTPVRLREGYDMGEVDQFLDEVEAELARLTKENDDLRAKLAAAQSAQPAQSAPSAGPVTAPEPQVAQAPAVAPAPVEQAPAPVAQEPTVTSTAAAPGIETIRVETVPQASNAAARLLELATRNHDALIETAKNDADKIVGEARTKAERLENESKGKADRLESDARTRAQMLDSETAERRQQLFGDLEREKEKLTAEVENLRSFEREYRSRLKSYFTQQLDALNSSGEASVPAPGGGDAPAPKRLRSILGEEEG